MNTKHILWLPFALVHVDLPSQVAVINRTFQSASLRVNHGGLSGYIDIAPPSHSSTVACVEWLVDGAGSRVTLALPFSLVGGVVQLSDSQLLVAGANPQAGSPTVGYLVRVGIDLAGASMSILETATYAGRDFFEAARTDGDPATVALIDWTTRELYCATLPPLPASPATPVLPASLTLAATSSQCRGLNGLDPRVAWRDGAFEVRGNKAGARFPVRFVAGRWQSEAPIDIFNNVWVADVAQGHSAPLRIASFAAALGADNSFVVEDLRRNTVVASGTVSAPQQWLTLPPVPDFYEFPGYPHRVVGPLSAESPTFHPLLRYGLPTPANPTRPRNVGRSDLQASTVYVGSPSSVFSTELTVTAIAPDDFLTQPPTQDGYLLLAIGFRGPGAPADPIVGTGINARLQFLAALHVVHGQSVRVGVVPAAVALPNLSFLEDCVVLSQWVFQDPSNPAQLLYSDICGARFAPGQGSSTLQAASGSAGGSGPGQGGSSAAGSPWRHRRNQVRDRLRQDLRHLGECPLLTQLRTNCSQ